MQIRPHRAAFTCSAIGVDEVVEIIPTRAAVAKLALAPNTCFRIDLDADLPTLEQWIELCPLVRRQRPPALDHATHQTVEPGQCRIVRHSSSPLRVHVSS